MGVNTWHSETSREEKQAKWGELIKDLISLANANSNFLDQKKYLIIGYCEKEKKFKDVKLDTDIGTLKQEITKRFNTFVKKPITNINIIKESIHENDVLVIEILPHSYFFELKKDLQNDGVTYRANSIIVRGIEKSDEISLADSDEIGRITSYFKNNDIFFPEDNENYRLHNRSIKYTVDLFKSQNQMWVEKNPPIINRDWKNRLIYEIYKLDTPFEYSLSFLYLHGHSTKKSTFEKIVLQDKLLRKNDPSLVILTDKSNKVSDNLSTIKKLYGLEKVYYIEDYGRDFIYNKHLDSLPYEKYNTDIFVQSYITKNNVKVNAINELKDWYHTEFSPLIVIKGSGGIGKTTIAKQFLDEIYDEKKGVLFIDSKEIVNDIIGSNFKGFFDFYTTKIRNNPNYSNLLNFDEKLLKLSIDNGSLIVVFDGIDEVISRLGSKFNIHNFVNEIMNEYCFNLGKCKFIITCRDYFWNINDLQYENDIKQLELVPFDENQVKQFFEQAFDTHSQRGKALKLVKEFNKSFFVDEVASIDQEYSPFVLDAVKYLIEIESNDKIPDNILELDMGEVSYLSKKLKNDYLMFKICNREYIKNNNISVNQQLEIFMVLAAEKKSTLSIYDMKTAIPFEMNEKSISSLCGHPFVKYNRSLNEISFKYDFLEEFFKGLIISKIFLDVDYDYFINEDTLNILSSVSSDFNLNNSIASRVSSNEEVKYYLIHFLEKLNSIFENEADKSKIEKEYYRSVSAVFLIAVSCFKNMDVNDIVDMLFSDATGEIKNFAITNVKTERIVLDFSNKIFIDSHFSNYNFFWKCKFNEYTRFKNCEFRLLEKQNGLNVNFSSKIFSSDCSMDSDFKEVLTLSEENKQSDFVKVKAKILKFLQLFQSNGNFISQKKAYINSKNRHGLSTDKFIDFEVIEVNKQGKLNEPEYIVTEKYRSLLRSIDQGSSNIKLDELTFRFLEK